MIDRRAFFDTVRPALFAGTMSEYQVRGLEAILDEWEKRGLQDLRWLAYMLATVKWETAHTMQPVAEYGKGRGHAYGVPDATTGQTYYGRGLVQLTWKRNYETMGRLLGVDLVNKPDLAMDMAISVRILFEGMLLAESGAGDFTGVSLERYFESVNGYFEQGAGDWFNARRIINGMDRSAEIGAMARTFYDALANATSCAVEPGGWKPGRVA